MQTYITFRNTMQSSSMAGALSRAATECEGRATLEPKNAGSSLPALDSIPTNIIDHSWGQDGLRQASKSSIGKILPQPNGNKALGEPVRRLEQSDMAWRRDSRRARMRERGRAARTASRSYHPLY